MTQTFTNLNVKIKCENLIDLVAISPNVHRGKPTQLGITTVKRGVAASDDESGGQVGLSKTEKPDVNLQPVTGEHSRGGTGVTRRNARLLPKPPSKVGGYATVSIPSRHLVTGSINYPYPADFPEESRTTVIKEEIRAVRDFNEKCDDVHPERELRELLTKHCCPKRS
jgi:hypothetical protein